jgi:xanthine dehydrogenase accessory factor
VGDDIRVYDVVDQVTQWRSQGRDVLLARVVSMMGLSSRTPGEVAAFTPGEPIAGRILSGSADGQFAELATEAAGGVTRLAEIEVGDRDAAAAGLSCGGRARVLLQRAEDIPAAAWAMLATREPVCLVTDITGDQLGRTSWVGLRPAAGNSDAARHPEEVIRLFGRGITDTAVLPLPAGDATGAEVAATDVLVAACWPTPRLLVLGEGVLAEALGRVAAVLGWTVDVTGALGAARTGAAELTRGDALVVLSHDVELSGAVLAAGLAGAAGYVGALGSRRTQAARAAWLEANGVSPDAVAAIRGPAGLDVGARTPAEIAVAILAEVLAVRSGAAGGPLRDRPGPVHPDGLHTPPQR